MSSICIHATTEGVEFYEKGFRGLNRNLGNPFTPTLILKILPFSTYFFLPSVSSGSNAAVVMNSSSISFPPNVGQLTRRAGRWTPPTNSPAGEKRTTRHAPQSADQT